MHHLLARHAQIIFTYTINPHKYKMSLITNDRLRPIETGQQKLVSATQKIPVTNKNIVA